MTKKLAWLENLINIELPQVLKAGEAPELVDYHARRLAVNIELTKRNLFEAAICKDSGKSTVSRLIWCYQKMLIRYQDILFEQNPGFWRAGKAQKEESLQWLIFDELDKLRLFLIAYFPAFYNTSEKISEIERELLAQNITSGAEVLWARFLPYNKEAIVETMLCPLTAFQEKKPGRITIEESLYLQKYLTLLLRIKVGVDREQVLELCEKRIFRYNLNSPRVFHYFIKSIQVKLESVSGHIAKTKLLALEHKRISNIYSKPGMAYRSALPSLKEQVSNWIIAEINFLEREVVIDSMVLEASSSDSTYHAKLPTNLSVHEIAILMRALLETGVVSSDSITKILNWAALSLESKKTNTISSESLRSKYYDPPEVSLKKLETYLESMRNLVKSLL